MKTRQFKRFLFALAAFAITTSSLRAEEFSFTVENATDQKISNILVSEDGKSWGHFDIGNGIAAGKTVNLVWDKSTNNEECKQYVKAVYADESEAEPARFDFCEEDLEIVFEE